MESYLEKSSEHQVKLVLHLDGLQGARSTKYKLTEKKLKDMIRRYVRKWNIPETAYPVSLRYHAQSTIVWVVKRFYNMKRESWRKIVIRGVGENKEYQEFLVTQVSTEDFEEGEFLARLFDIEESTLRQRKQRSPGGSFTVEKALLLMIIFSFPFMKRR